MKREIRVPQQKRSMEKRNNIIEAAYKIFNEKGYNNTNTAEIAKEASIATGSLYAYFVDKKDIFIEVLKKYSNSLIDLVIKEFEEIPEDEDILEVIKKVINTLLKSHDFSKNFHEELMALSHLDMDIRKHFKLQQKEIMDKVGYQLKKRNIKVEKEKILLIVITIDALCHEIIYSEDEVIDKDSMITECANMIKYLLKSS